MLRFSRGREPARQFIHGKLFHQVGIGHLNRAGAKTGKNDVLRPLVIRSESAIFPNPLLQRGSLFAPVHRAYHWSEIGEI
jgi:hypothetical protein